MDVDVRNQKGQALFEFIIFVPFLLVMLSTMLTVAASINGSINQQKATRSYLYFLLKGNSNVPDSNRMKKLTEGGLRNVGVFSIGWKERDINDQPISACYKIIPFGGTELEQTCEDSAPAGTEISNFIKPRTMYGLCGSSYTTQGGQIVNNDMIGNNTIATTCTIQP
jgi:hypothetical protein